MKFLHLSDLHIGKQVNGFSMIEDQRHVLQQVVDLLQVHGAQALVLAGDVYDKSAPSEEAVRLLDWFLAQVAALGVTVLAVPGNHDSADRLAFAQGLLSRQGVHFPPAFSGPLSSVTLHDQHGPVTFWLLPFLRPIDARRAFPQVQIGNDYTAAVKAVLDNCGCDQAQRNVLVAHQFVTAGGCDTQRSQGELNLGGLDNVDVSVFDAFDYVALGHVHRAQRIGRDTVRYAGSLLKYNFSEIRYDKSAVLVELGPKPAGSSVGVCVSFQLLPLVPLHDMRQIAGPLDQLLDPEVVAGQDAQDYLQVILTDEVPRLDAMARLRSCYPNVMALEHGTARQVAQQDQAAPSLEGLLQLEPQDLFAEFFNALSGKDLTQEQEELANKLLMQCLAEVEGGAR